MSNINTSDLQNALADAFPTWDEFRMLILDALGERGRKRLIKVSKNYVGHNPDIEVSYSHYRDVIDVARSLGKLNDLIAKACDMNPDNPELEAFIKKNNLSNLCHKSETSASPDYEYAPTGSLKIFLEILIPLLPEETKSSLKNLLQDGEIQLTKEAKRAIDSITQESSSLALERLIQTGVRSIDAELYARKMLECFPRICLIKYTPRNKDHPISGTGFLVGPNVIMTNYHVMEPVIHWEERRDFGSNLPWAKPRDVELIFDYRFKYRKAKNSDHYDEELGNGVPCKLVNKGWLLDSSPMSPVDTTPDQGDELPATNHLDYALLQTVETPGNDPLVSYSGLDAPTRGWFKLHASYEFEPGLPLYILQHPNGAPLKFAPSTNAIITVNKNKTRISYRTNTEPGASGSPCFNQNWDPVAIHHLGDPNFDNNYTPTYNQGIPFAAILALLEKRGKQDLIEAR